MALYSMIEKTFNEHTLELEISNEQTVDPADTIAAPVGAVTITPSALFFSTAARLWLSNKLGLGQELVPPRVPPPRTSLGPCGNALGMGRRRRLARHPVPLGIFNLARARRATPKTYPAHPLCGQVSAGLTSKTPEHKHRF